MITAGSAFWLLTEQAIRRALVDDLKTDAREVEWIVTDILRRCADLPAPSFPPDPTSRAYRHFGLLIADLITFEKQLYALQYDRSSGACYEHESKPIETAHPFVSALNVKVAQVEAEVAEAAAKQGLAIEYVAGRWRSVNRTASHLQ